MKHSFLSKSFRIFTILFILLGMITSSVSAAQDTPPTPEVTPTASLAPLPDPALISVEPASLSAAAGGEITVKGLEFEDGFKVRLDGIGLIDTTFVNSEYLKATIPAGSNPGTYPVKVVPNSGGEFGGAVSVTLTGSQTVNEPSLLITQYEPDPDQPRAGDTFRVIFYILNAGSAPAKDTYISFGSGSFIPFGQTTRSIGDIAPGATTSIEVKFRVPSAAAGGVSALPVNLDAKDGNGKLYNWQQSISIEVFQPTATPPVDSTSTGARLVIVSSRSAPEVVLPGMKFELFLSIRNMGTRPAYNILLRPDSASGVMLSGGRNNLVINNIPAGQQVEISVPMVSNSTVKAGTMAVQFTLEHGNPVESNTQSVGINFESNLSTQPKLILSGYQAEPQVIRPGTPFELTLLVTNVGGGDADGVTLTLGGKDGAGLKPFSPLGSSNVKFTSFIPAGETSEITFNLLPDGTSEAKIYNLSVGLDYADPFGGALSDNQVISLMVQKPPLLQIDFYEPLFPMPMDQPIRLPIQIINLGSDRANLLSMEVTSEAMQIDNNSMFVGRLEGGGFFSMDAMAFANQSGTLEVNVTVNYLDGFNQIQSITQVLTVEVMEAQPMPIPGEIGPDGLPIYPDGEMPPQGPQGGLLNTLLRILKGLFGLGS
jgi:hypothetical protein